jgi:hypothetical protein
VLVNWPTAVSQALSTTNSEAIGSVSTSIGSAGGKFREAFTHGGVTTSIRRMVLKRERARYSRYAKATFRKDRRLNIRLSSKDLEAIQKRALAEGLPYQTLISSLLHKYAAGRLKDV